MKKILILFAFIFCAILSFAQIPKYPQVQQSANTDSSILITNAIQPRAGLINGVYADTTAANLRHIRQYPFSQIATTSDGKMWYRNVNADTWIQYSSGSNLVANGITTSGDTTILGDSLDRYTVIQVLSHLTNGSRYNHLLLSNLPVTGYDPYPTMLTYNPSTFGIRRVYSTANGDIDSVFYGGAISTLNEVFRDSTDIYFKAGVRNERLAGGGYEGVYQYFPPRDSMIINSGRDGQAANTLYAQFDLGNSWGYNINVIPEPTLPEYPLGNIRSSIDLIRTIDNTRRKKMVGIGLSGYVASFKTYQTLINSATYEAANYWGQMTDITAYGDLYPLIGVSASKDKILRVATLDTNIGVKIRPRYLPTNTTYNGISLWAQGDSDYAHINGFLSVGGSLPTKQNGGQSFIHKFNVTGDSWASDTTHGFIVDGNGYSVRLPYSVGNQGTIAYWIQDSAQQQADMTMEQPASFDSRLFRIRVGNNTPASTYPNTGTGFRMEFQTGGSSTNITRLWRNGNWTMGSSVGITAYRLYKKLAVDGSVLVNDTLTIKNIATAPAGDTTNYFNLGINSNGDVFKVSYGSGSGGSGTDNANAGSGYRWLKPSTQEIKTLFSAYGITYDSTTNTDGLTARIDSSSGGLQTYMRGMKIIDSMVAVNNTRYWNLSGNSATSGKETGSFVGTTNSVALRFGTNGTRRMYLDSARAQLVIGSPTINANDALIIQGLSGGGNYDGITMYPNNLSTKMTYGSAGIQRAGGIDINTSSGGISLSPNTGVFIGTSFTAATAYLHIKAGTATASTAPFKLTTGTVNTTAEAGALEYTTPRLFFTNGGLVRQELIQGQQSRVSTQFDKTNTTLADVTGLTANVAAGKIYRFEATLYTTSDVAGGVKVAIAGTATATNIIYEGLTTDAGLTTQSRATTLATAVGAVTAVTAAYIKVTGTITVNAAGTLTVQFAENAAVNTSSVLVGSTFVVMEMN